MTDREKGIIHGVKDPALAAKKLKDYRQAVHARSPTFLGNPPLLAVQERHETVPGRRRVRRAVRSELLVT